MPTYDDLATELRQRAAQLIGEAQFWIGLAGAPGSGKSTLAAALRERLGDLLTVIPMDGYHHTRRQLDGMEDPGEAHARRGAPFTFDAQRLVATLIKARQDGEGSFPSYDRGVHDPVADRTRLRKGPQVVLVEGNYLLLDDMPWRQLRQRVFDETWFLQVPLSECYRRVRSRHMEAGLTEEQAQGRIDSNDSLNATLITEVSPQYADRIIQIR